MNTTAILKKLEAYKTPFALRARAELMHLDSISQVRDGCYDARLADAGALLLRSAEVTGAITAADMYKFENSLMDLSAVAKEYTLHMVGHAHIDMNWQWGYNETVAATLETFRTVLKLMEEYPEFTYSQSQASVYQMVEKYEPEMLEEIRMRIKEKRWEVTAATWVEGDKNMSSGESQCRHLLYTKRYLSKLLDIDPSELRLDYEPDTFGHGIHVPEVLRNGGVDWMYHCRGCDKRDIYRWCAPSGKEVLVFQEPKWYIAMLYPIFLADYPKFCARVGDGSLRDALVVYGVGDHGGGPTRRDLELICEMQTWPLFPTVKFSRYDTYYKILEEMKHKFPVYEGEINFVFDGCYTTQSRIKMANSLSEKRLYDAEAMTAMAGLCGNSLGCADLLEEGWQNTLFNQFHDILPGSNMVDSREWTMGKFQETLAAANTVANRALRAITARIDTTGIPFDNALSTTSEGAGAGYNMSNHGLYPFHFTERGRGTVRAWHIFNTTQYDRDEFVELQVWDYSGDITNASITDSNGKLLPFKVLVFNESYMVEHKVSKLLVRVQVPAFGYTTIVLQPSKYIEPSKDILSQMPDGPRQEHDLGNQNYILENDEIYCEFDSVSCTLVSLRNKASGCELVAEEKAGYFEYVEENPRFGMTAWRVGPAMRKVNLNSSHKVRVTNYVRDTVRSILAYQIEFQNSLIRVKVVLDAGKKYLDYDIIADWVEKGTRECIPALRFIAEPGYSVNRYRYTSGSGSIVRDPLPHDVPSLGTMEYLPEDYQSAYLVLFSESKYGFRGYPGDSGVHLIRSAVDPDPHPELGRQYLHICLGTATSEADMNRTFTCTSHKLSPISCYSHDGERSLEGRLLNYSGDCYVTALYVNKSGNTVMRLFNPDTVPQKVVLGSVREVYLADTLEHIMDKIDKSSDQTEVIVPSNSYITLILTSL